MTNTLPPALASLITQYRQRLQALVVAPAQLVVVSKYASLEATEAMIHAGASILAESRPVEAWKKRQALPPSVEQSVDWHFIGHLQTNKLKYVLGHYRLIHSVDSIGLLEAMTTYLEKHPDLGQQAFLMQVNTANDPQKQGFTPQEAEALVPTLAQQFPRLHCQGLMCMAKQGATPPELHATFASLRGLRDSLNERHGLGLEHLSMGMSHDYAIALQEGATLVRLGQRVFNAIQDA